MTDSDTKSSRLFNQLAAEEKKTIVALALIAVMAFMWARVLGGKTTESAKAALTEGQLGLEQSNSQAKISFIELPKIKGRNDVLTRDFFNVDRWQNFMTGTAGVNVVSKDGNKEYVNKVAKKLRLQAIVLGNNSQAFVNDKLLSIGDKLRIVDGANTYECQVVGVRENSVSIKCGEAEIVLKLPQPI